MKYIFIYHVTKKKNIKSILKEGLRLGDPKHEYKVTWVWKNIKDAMWYADLYSGIIIKACVPSKWIKRNWGGDPGFYTKYKITRKQIVEVLDKKGRQI